MTVRWGLSSYPELLAELGIERPLLVTSRRWESLDLEAAKRFSGVESSRQLYVVRTRGRKPTRAAEAFLAFARERLA